MKKYTSFVRLCPIGLLLVTAFFFNGCSVFSSIGSSISLGYENMVSYFNGYYNATNLFSEAEDEINTAALAARGKETASTQPVQIPGTAKQKLGQVIDKCSNILAFHPTSSLVDNALLLIGKSFYYQAEYLKAERKFAELLAQFPNSSLTLEAQIWYARSTEKLGKLEDGVRLSQIASATAQANGDRDIETQAYLLLGNIYRRMNQTDKSIAEYEKAISISHDDDVRGNAQISMGDIFFENKQYKKAVEVYLRAAEYTSDVYSNYYSKLQASIAYRETGDLKNELSLLNSMIDDFRNRQYLASILFERANNYAASRRRDDAISEYIYVDTTFVRTEYAVRSAYQLGQMFEAKNGNYTEALKYYSEVAAPAAPSMVADGRRKCAALTRYFNAWRQLNYADSLLFVLSDTTRKIITDSLQRAASDSIRIYRTDSLTRNTPDSMHHHIALVDSLIKYSRSDSLKTMPSLQDTSQRKLVPAPVPPVLLSADSLHILKSIAAGELGDIFYSEISEPDSAFYWYNKSLSWNYHQARSPRILYILAELSRINPEKKFATPEEHYARLDHDFPESIYAQEARRFLQKTKTAVKVDTAAEYYIQSEKQIESGQDVKAIETLRSLIHSFPKSPYTAKSQYAIGWILENRLAQPESALVQYKRVAKDYKDTRYAAAASRKIVDDRPEPVAKTDTSKIKSILPHQKTAGPDTLHRNTTGVIADTVRQQQKDSRGKYFLQQQKKTNPDSLQRNTMDGLADTVNQQQKIPRGNKIPVKKEE